MMSEVVNLYHKAGVNILNKEKIEKIKKMFKIIDFLDTDSLLYSCIANYKRKNGLIRGYESRAYDYYECFAILILSMWDDLKQLDKKKIRSILNGK